MNENSKTQNQPIKSGNKFINIFRNTSKKHSLLALLGAVLITAFGVLRAPLNLTKLAWSSWILVILFPLTSIFLYYVFIRLPERSIFRSVRCLCHLGAPILLVWLMPFFFDPNRESEYSEKFLGSFFPFWAMIWCLGALVLHWFLRLLEYLGKKILAKNGLAAKYLRDLTVMYTPQKTLSADRREGKRKWVTASICIILVSLGAFIFAVSLFLFNVYSNMEFEAILFTITYAEGGLAVEDIIAGTEYTLLFVVISSYICYHMVKCFRNEKLVVADSNRSGRYTLVMTGKKRVLQVILAVLVLVGCFTFFSIQTNFMHYIAMKSDKSTIYETYYVKPDESVLTFPEKKRNLIFIYLESFENTYASREAGGSQDQDYISALTELTKEKDCVNFSNTEKLGGASVFVPAITYTQGSTVAQTSGIALNTKILPPNGVVEYPSMTRLEDVLHDNGYNQLYIEGSKGMFSMYDKYVARYDDSILYDRIKLVEDGYAEEDTDYIWKWGIEDRKLFEITKELITDAAKEDKPFFVTMYTMDTHSFECGHRCSLCDESIGSDYLAAANCTSKQTMEFVNWLREQPFYENTTIILVGDHLGNQKTSLVSSDEGYVRTTYNCFINAAKEPTKTTNRLFSSLDMFPTTLSAIGVDIQGDRLGLGTDLFSSTETLAEQLGEEEYKKQLEQTSDYYDTVFAPN